MRIRAIVFIALMISGIFMGMVQGDFPYPVQAETVMAENSAQGGFLQNTAGILRTPWASTALLIIGILGFLVELVTMSTMAGLIGMMAMGVFFGAFIMGDPSRWWLSIIFLGGIIFLALEIFVLPGHGISGIIGLVCVFASVFAVMPDTVMAGIIMLISALISGAVFAWILKYLPRSRTFSKFILQTRQTDEEGYGAPVKRTDLEGAMGTTVTDLRPHGVALINNERVEVSSQGGFLKKDTTVRVVKVDGLKITVESL